MRYLCIILGLALIASVTWATEGLRILSVTDATVTVDLSGTEGIGKGICFEVWKDDALLGFLQAGEEVRRRRERPSALSSPERPTRLRRPSRSFRRASGSHSSRMPPTDGRRGS